MKMKSQLFSIAIVLLFGHIIAEISIKCLQCICDVESGCNHKEDCNNNGGYQACGPFHIHEGYWIDCGKPGLDYKNCTLDYECSKECVTKYMKRYGGITCSATCEDYAKMHNGGPYGCQNNATDTYWSRMMSVNCTSTS